MGKHELKQFLRGAYARVLFHTGLHAVVNRMMPRRLTILFGHCVTAEEVNGFLPPDMKIDGPKLESILRWFGRRYELESIGGGLARLGGAGKRSVVALSMDDGYRDNRSALLPILERTGAGATVFLETRPLDERRVNWSHKFFWLLSRGHAIDLLARRYQERTEDAATRESLRKALEEESDLVYRVKRVLKYDADPDDRDRVLEQLFRDAGGDEEQLCSELYLTWDDARALRDAGVELGGHTVSHHILARLSPERQGEEVGRCAAAMERELGSSGKVFAYPFGRSWDYDQNSVQAARDAGYGVAVNTHAGTNDARGGYELRRLPIDNGAELHLLVAEACGGFDLLRRLGLDLSA
ncbi:MAG: polysaccharide deacetylase family protein [Planctomycetota bacterium]